MADLLYTGDRLLIGTLLVAGVIGTFAAGLAIALAAGLCRGVRILRRRRRVRRTLRQLEAHANHPAFNRLRAAIREQREEKP